MNRHLERLGMLIFIGIRNLRSQRTKTLIVGFIMVFGAFLVVTTTALLDSIEDGMTRSITGSLAGHLQLYSADAEDDLALFGGQLFDNQNIGIIEDFAEVRRVVEGLDEVEAVIPMGLGRGTALTSSPTDEAIDALRQARLEGDTLEIEAAIERLQQIGALLKTEFENRLSVASDADQIHEALADIETLGDEEFWEPLRVPDSGDLFDEADARDRLEFLSTRIASLSEDGRTLFLRFLGTDTGRFPEAFDRLKVVRGEKIPPFERGLLVSERTAQRYFKNRVARDLDAIRDEVEGGTLIAENPSLESRVQALPEQYNRVLIELDPRGAAQVREALQEHLGAEDQTLTELLREFLAVDDRTIGPRHDLFYEVIAPHIDLYAIDVGDTVAVRTFTQGGFLRAANVKIWGTFEFSGLEDADIAGSAHLMDMVTFRDLMGVFGEEEMAELRAIREDVGLRDVQRDTAEDELFGGGGALVDDGDSSAGFGLADEAVSFDRDRSSFTYDQRAVDQGIALNAAVILRDASDLRASQALVQAAADEADLGLQVVDWQSASGIVGQFIAVIRVTLFIAMGIIFLIALVIINNAVVMATMERTSEIGTLRAIGAPRSTVLTMILVETVVLGVVAGGIGAFGAAGLLLYFGQVGIAATNDVLRFLFSGPRLYPMVTVAHVLTGVAAITAVGLISTLYPARLAARIQPVTAMRRGE